MENQNVKQAIILMAFLLGRVKKIILTLIGSNYGKKRESWLGRPHPELEREYFMSTHTRQSWEEEGDGPQWLLGVTG